MFICTTESFGVPYHFGSYCLYYIFWKLFHMWPPTREDHVVQAICVYTTARKITYWYYIKEIFIIYRRKRNESSLMGLVCWLTPTRPRADWLDAFLNSASAFVFSNCAIIFSTKAENVWRKHCNSTFNDANPEPRCSGWCWLMLCGVVARTVQIPHTAYPEPRLQWSLDVMLDFRLTSICCASRNLCPCLILLPTWSGEWPYMVW